MIDPSYDITDEASLRNLFPPTHDIAAKKVQDHIGRHVRDFISRSPFLCISTQDADGNADISPRGDPVGFVKILDEHTLAIPDRPGNNRLDTVSNILSNSNVGLIFMIPGYDETMRVSGKALLTTDPDILKEMAVNDRTPTLAIIIKVEEVFIHCAKAFRRSHLWDPNHLQNRSDMPSLIKIALDQIGAAPDDAAEQQALDDGLEESYKTTMY